MRMFRQPLSRCLLSLLLIVTVTSVSCVDGDPVSSDQSNGGTKITVTPVTPATPLARANTNFGDAIGTASQTATGITATLKDPGGQLLATLVWSQADGTIVLDAPGKSHLEGFDNGTPLKLKASTYAVYYYYLQVEQALADRDGLTSGLDKAPGCDFFPDAWETECIRACCDAHDACWAANNCNMLSWLGVGSAACKGCNIAVVACMAACVIKAVVDIFHPVEQH